MNTKTFTRGIIALLTLGAGMFLTSCKGNIDLIDPPVMITDPILLDIVSDMVTVEGKFTDSHRINLQDIISLQDIVSNMVTVEGGTFEMLTGRFEMLTGRKVTLGTFYMSKYQVTQAQWRAVMGTNPDSYFSGANLPVESVSWNVIVGTTGATMVIDGMTYYEDGFVYKLNQLTGKKFRLPTEAEWQYAASGGAYSMGYTYSGSNMVGEVAWYTNNSMEGYSARQTHPVGTKAPNELGLYDMSGNVDELCYDAWSDPLARGRFTNPVALGTAGSYRVVRGGSWRTLLPGTTVFSRVSCEPRSSFDAVGFRLACSAKQLQMPPSFP